MKGLDFENILRVILAGVFFGAWPIVMNRSGLGGMMSAVSFAGFAFLFVLPFGVWNQVVEPQTIHLNSWWSAIFAGFLGAMGVIAFNGMLSRAKPVDMGTLIAVMTVIQVLIPSLYSMYSANWEISQTKGVALGLAAVSIFMLLRE